MARRGPSRPAVAPLSLIQREPIPWPFSKAVPARYARFQPFGIVRSTPQPYFSTALTEVVLRCCNSQINAKPEQSDAIRAGWRSDSSCGTLLWAD